MQSEKTRQDREAVTVREGHPYTPSRGWVAPPTWALEQLVLGALLFLAVALQLDALAPQHRLSARVVAGLLLSAAGTFAAQKVRSMADRQREADQAAHVIRASMSCSGRVALWGSVAQGLALASGIVAAPAWPHVAIAAYVAGYPLWRRLYRRLS